MERYPTNPKSLLSTFIKHHPLIAQMVRRDVLGRYRGSTIGFFWSFITPLILLAVYTFVFSVVFQARWGERTENRLEFALVLFCGLVVFNVFAECLNRSPTLILNNTIFVKKVVFPLEILPIVALYSALVHAACSFAVLLLGFLLLGWSIPITILLLPLAILPLILLTLGLSWFLSSIGVFLRDIGVVIGLVTTILLFMSPIFYPVSSVPEAFRMILEFNPIGQIVEQTRSVVLWGIVPNWITWALTLLSTALISWLGFAWFQKTRKGFADVI